MIKHVNEGNPEHYEGKTMNTIYTTRDDAIWAEIIKPIEATGVVEDACLYYNIEAIANTVLDDYEHGYACQVDPDEFWDIVAAHEVIDGDHRIV